MILVTGCNTLLGRTLMRRLIKNKEKIRCLDLHTPYNHPKNVEFVSTDLLNIEVLKNACKGVNAVFHFLDIKRTGQYTRDYMQDVNVEGTRNLLHTASKLKIKKFFFLSSFSVYGTPKGMPIRQDDKKKPITHYGKDKLKCENLCWEYIDNKKYPVIIFRPALVTGPDIKDPIINTVLHNALCMADSNKLLISGNLNSKFQLLHPDDAVDAFMLAYKSKSLKGTVYNIGSDNVPSQVEQMVKIKEKANLDYVIEYISPLKVKILAALPGFINNDYFSKELMIYLLHSIILDCQRIKKDLGWQPKKNNIDILLDTIEWFKKIKSSA